MLRCFRTQRRHWCAVSALSLLVLSLSGARHELLCPVAPPFRGRAPCAVLRLHGGEDTSDERSSDSVIQRPGCSEHCNCGDPECPYAPEPPETAEEAQDRAQREALEEYVRRVESGERPVHTQVWCVCVWVGGCLCVCM